jgi:hypothetical protein
MSDLNHVESHCIPVPASTTEEVRAVERYERLVIELYVRNRDQKMYVDIVGEMKRE